MFKAFVQKLKDIMKKLGARLSSKRDTPTSEIKDKSAV